MWSLFYYLWHLAVLAHFYCHIYWLSSVWTWALVPVLASSGCRLDMELWAPFSFSLWSAHPVSSDQGSNPQPFGVLGDVPTNWATWPGLQAIFNPLSVSIDLPFLDISYKWNQTICVLCVLFLSFNIMVLRFICVVAQTSSFLFPNSLPLYEYTVHLSICSPVDGYDRCY